MQRVPDILDSTTELSKVRRYRKTFNGVQNISARGLRRHMLGLAIEIRGHMLYTPGELTPPPTPIEPWRFVQMVKSISLKNAINEVMPAWRGEHLWLANLAEGINSAEMQRHDPVIADPVGGPLTADSAFFIRLVIPFAKAAFKLGQNQKSQFNGCHDLSNYGQQGELSIEFDPDRMPTADDTYVIDETRFDFRVHLDIVDLRDLAVYDPVRWEVQEDDGNPVLLEGYPRKLDLGLFCGSLFNLDGTPFMALDLKAMVENNISLDADGEPVFRQITATETRLQFGDTAHGLEQFRDYLAVYDALNTTTFHKTWTLFPAQFFYGPQLSKTNKVAPLASTFKLDGFKDLVI